MIGPQTLPKISCLMVTAGGRLNSLKHSYQCYLDQTYPNRELVIVNDGPDEYQAEIARLVGDQAKTVFLRPSYSLGALRNISIALSAGDLWIQWDDDDFNSPERISVQYAFLRKYPQAKACFLGDQLHYYVNERQIYWESWAYSSGGHKPYRLIPGTILSYRGDYRYPSSGEFCKLAEDSVLAERMLDTPENVEILTGCGHLNVYSYNGRNVWDYEHHMAITKLRSYYTAYLWENKSKICRTLQYMNFGKVDVMGRDGLAFTYGE
jgi:glycosyltransferase involved in cell wall biosynthesis